jgi:steroid 5-alpha reductase family enzyme
VWAGSYGGQWVSLPIGDSQKIFLVCALIAFFMQWLAFIPAFINKTEHFFDLTGGLAYLAVIGFALWQSGPADLRTLLITGLMGLWAVRLASFLFLRVRRQGSDSRFDEIKLSFPRFLVAWTMQGLWVLLTAAAGLAAITSAEKVPMAWIGWLGVTVWLLGFSIEVLADRQKTLFKQNPANQGKFIQQGLWAHSRHPNYFGEIILWLGMALIAYPALVQWQLITLISPVFVALLLMKFSGVPLLEAQAEQRWQGDPDYQRYKVSTPVLLPKIFK